MLRKRTKAIKARDYAGTDGDRPCPFCERKHVGTIIEKTNYMFVSENILPYDVFEGGVVQTHYMLIPIEHRETMAQFTQDEQLDYLRLIAKYEQRGLIAILGP